MLSALVICTSMMGSGVSRTSDFLKANTPTAEIQIILAPDKARNKNW
jgi:hypothetical protein